MINMNIPSEKGFKFQIKILLNYIRKFVLIRNSFPLLLSNQKLYALRLCVEI